MARLRHGNRAVFSALRVKYPMIPEVGLQLHKPGVEEGVALVKNTYPDTEIKPYKVQCFDEAGLGEHITFATWEQTLRAAVALGYVEPVQDRLEALVQSAAWQECYRVEVVSQPRGYTAGVIS